MHPIAEQRIPSVRHQVRLPTISPWSTVPRHCYNPGKQESICRGPSLVRSNCDSSDADPVRLDVHPSGNPITVAPGSNKAHMRRRYALSRHNIAYRHHHRAHTKASAGHLLDSSKASSTLGRGVERRGNVPPAIAIFNSMAGSSRAVSVASLLPHC